MIRRRLGLAALVAVVGCGCATQKIAAPKELPLTRVSVYRNGVGYFERSGKIRADRLQFKVRPDYIGDFLATLAVMEKGGSSIRSASFPIRVAPTAQPVSEDGEPVVSTQPALETVVLELDGEEHELAIGYVTEQPVWKPSYRLVIGEDGLTMQAWGIVQNLSGEDWTDVRLSLVAGAPIAFEATLQIPVTPRRPVVSDSGELIGAVPRAESTLAQRPQQAPPPASPPPPALRPPSPPKTSRESPQQKGAPQKKEHAPGAPRAPMDYDQPQAPQPTYTMEDAAPRNVSLLAAQTVEGGSTRYDLPHPVTIPKDSATMVLLLAQKVGGESVFMFAPEAGVPDSARHPFRVVRFKNDTPGLLERGPIAVYEASSFLGQGVMESLSAGGEATVPFALDRGLALDSDRQNLAEHARLARIEHGALYIERDQVVKTTYRVRNGKTEAARVVVRHPRMAGMRLHNPPAGSEDQVGKNVALVPVKIAAHGNTELKVDERRAYQTHADWFSAEADDAVRAYIADARADPKIADALRRAWTIREAIIKATEEQAKLQAEQGILESASEQTRDNLRAIAKNRQGVDALRKQLTDRLTEFDAKLGQVTKRLVELNLSLSEQRVRFTETLRDVKLSEPLPVP